MAVVRQLWNLNGTWYYVKSFKKFEMRQREDSLKTREDKCLVMDIYLEALSIKI